MQYAARIKIHKETRPRPRAEPGASVLTGPAQMVTVGGTALWLAGLSTSTSTRPRSVDLAVEEVGFVLVTLIASPPFSNAIEVGGE
jgi:hypothetical protein